ncbi:calcium-binding protein [Pseudogemmobacter bohemicus]|uniref:calcium-binding protein n=1 Tax=Pseudogemmobacter bohemicus TaxID=2250708 RepID=UPI000DD480B4|nr:calcium-binding protein [Pseudogemmobacter bohemicus]
MAFTIATTSTGTGTRYTLAASYDEIYVPRSALVVSTDGWAIMGIYNHIRVTVAGEVIGSGRGLAVGLGEDSLGGYIHVLNGGVVSGTERAISAYGIGLSIINNGTISSAGSAITTGSASGTVTIRNTGEISGNMAINVNSAAAGARTVIYNSGDITGISNSFTSGLLSSTTIFNSGTMVGNISFGGGSDVYDGRSGSINGIVFGNAGNDVFIGNPNQAETFNGGDGVDTLDFRYAGSVILALDLSRANAGQALGDTYFNVENIFGSQQNDILTGSNINNVLTGEDGNDWLHGRGGNDILRGGPGADTMAGGAGNDIFQYMHIDDGGDTIMDFLNIAGNNDAFQISAAGFGGGLAAGVLAASAFQSGVSNVAANANVRFLYRTTDNTVWYDADGNGADAAVLLATLQSGATLSNADFLIF